MVITISSGKRRCTGAAILCWCLAFSPVAFAWQQEYIADDTRGNTPDRYTWDSDHQPDYNAVLAERISSAGDALYVGGGMTAAGQDAHTGWRFALPDGFSTGPDINWQSQKSVGYVDDSIDAGSDGVDSLSSVGWRVDYSLGAVKPWARVSFNHLDGDGLWWAPAGMFITAPGRQQNRWRDLSFGADMPLTSHMAAWAALSQAEGMNSGEAFMYSLGVSAKF
ncbi:hypothetical protein [Entomohabitans teleogrylli]|uniref:hypothetical protein n=1 Tax=Entomohabitans teleogrylli TaxID=1384589 RepID=UPI00073D305C|nr:hypothetical protein [Entomohabitans teleogrylli]